MLRANRFPFRVGKRIGTIHAGARGRLAHYMPKSTNQEPTTANSAYVVKPVLKSLRVLAALGDAGRELRLAEVVQLVKLPKATVYKYLKTLCVSGFLSYDKSEDTYWLGARAWSLGRTVDPSLRVRELAYPLMRELRDQCGETVNLGVMNGPDVVYLEMAQSRHTLRMQATIGAHDPVYSTSLGKAILAFRPPEQWHAHLPTRIAARTRNTVTSIDALRRELAATRKRGYSIDNGENEEGAWCVGAPIYDQDGGAIAAISISAVANRVSRDLETEFARLIIATAEIISCKLGYKKP